MQKVLEIKNISKYFGALKANDAISFDVYKNEVHAIVGENGAGKSTLMNIIYGLYQPDEGEIVINGQTANFTGSKDALEAGIGMVHQHFMLVPTMTVLQNIIVGKEPHKGISIDFEAAKREIEAITDLYNLKIDLMAKVQDISIGMKQKVEIVKALYRGADIFILDEPSAVLTPQEIEKLYEIIDIFKQQQKTTIFITHKLDEVKRVADRISVLRRGQYVGTVKNEDVDTVAITKMMVGREVAVSGANRAETAKTRPILQLNHVCAKNKTGKLVLNDVSFEIKGGEILGIAGVDGNGQLELVEVISGKRKANSGSVLLYEKDIAKQTIGQIRALGLGYIPEDRHKQGLILDYSVKYNLILGLHRQKRFSRMGWIDFKNVAQEAADKVKKYDIRLMNYEVNAATLSGGNQQKVVIAREMERNSQLIIAMQPTRGLDVGAIEFVHKTLIEARNNQRAVLLVSFELDEILALSDRIAVFHEGRVVGIVDRKDATRVNLGVMMLSGKRIEGQQ